MWVDFFVSEEVCDFMCSWFNSVWIVNSIFVDVVCVVSM